MILLLDNVPVPVRVLNHTETTNYLVIRLIIHPRLPTGTSTASKYLGFRMVCIPTGGAIALLEGALPSTLLLIGLRERS
jgi:hypothetical protein